MCSRSFPPVIPGTTGNFPVSFPLSRLVIKVTVDGPYEVLVDPNPAFPLQTYRSALECFLLIFGFSRVFRLRLGFPLGYRNAFDAAGNVLAVGGNFPGLSDGVVQCIQADLLCIAENSIS